MSLKQLFSRRRERSDSNPTSPPVTPQFLFVRSDTNSQTVIHPPTGFSQTAPTSPIPSSLRASFLGSKKGHQRNRSNHSINIPQDLPSINSDGIPELEAQWEHRAAVLAQGPEEGSAHAPDGHAGSQDRPISRSRSVTSHQDEDKTTDNSIQVAIELHEKGQLERSTCIFGRLADPDGANNPLAQVLYGLALRHGWGTEVDLPRALIYLQAAARNSAAVEEEALRAGMKKGGKAKGELVLAMYELGNCFRNGWGVEKDANAAREYYETAANLGDSDAQNEVAWCYLEGFGCKKDKKKAAKYYRLAEKQGNKILGNTWIYKDKYMDGD